MNSSDVQPPRLLEATVVSSYDAQCHVLVETTQILRTQTGDHYQSSGKTEHQIWQK